MGYNSKNVKESYDIGNAEMYLGKERRYIGISKGDTEVNIETEQVKLEAGFPKKTYATAKSSEVGTITGSTPNTSMENLARMLGATVQALESGSKNVVDEGFEFPDKTTTQYLNNADVESVVINNAPSSEQVEEYVSDGSKGSTAGDFSLNWPITATSDVASVVVDGVSYSVVGTGSADTSSGALSVEVDTSTGDLQFFEGDGAAANAIDVEGLIRITYTPVPTPLTEDTDYKVDPSNGGIIPIDTANYDTGTPYFVNYTYTYPTKKRINFGGSSDEAPAQEIFLKKKLANGKVREFTIWKAKVTNGMQYNMAEEDFHELPIEMEMLADTTKPAGSQLMRIDEYEG